MRIRDAESGRGRSADSGSFGMGGEIDGEELGESDISSCECWCWRQLKS